MNMHSPSHPNANEVLKTKRKTCRPTKDRVSNSSSGESFSSRKARVWSTHRGSVTTSLLAVVRSVYQPGQDHHADSAADASPDHRLPPTEGVDEHDGRECGQGILDPVRKSKVSRKQGRESDLLEESCGIIRDQIDAVKQERQSACGLSGGEVLG